MTVSRPVDFIGVGAGKCGSTWLHDNLAKHPQVCDSNLKELNYFSDLYDEHPFSWYESQYCDCGPSLIRGEFSVTYLAHPEAPKRIKRHYPEVRLLAIVRDPVRRTFSNYLHSIRKGDISPKMAFAEFIQDDRNLAPARYHEHLARWFALFPRERIHVIVLEEFLSDPLAGYRKLFEFLQIDPSFVPPGYDRPSNEARAYRYLWVENALVRTYRFLSRRGYTRLVKRVVDSRVGEWIRAMNSSGGEGPSLLTADRDVLVEYFGPHNRELSALIGRDLSRWSQSGRGSPEPTIEMDA